MNKKRSFIPLVSIIIPTLNRSKSLKIALTSIYKTNYSRKKLEVIVIDNNSSDNTVSMLKDSFKQVILIRNNINRGFAPALNQGIKKSSGKYILTTNDDVVFDKKCISEMVKVGEKDKRIGILGGKMLFEGKEKQIALSGFRVNLYLGYHPYDFEGQDIQREMDVATGGCMLIRKSALAKSGIYDEGFFFCGEDYDLCFRMKYAGFKIIYVPTAIVTHKFLNSGRKKDNFSQLFAHYRGKIRFMLIHASLLQFFTFSLVQIFIGPFYCYLQSGQKIFFPLMTAVFWNIKNIGETLQRRKGLSRYD